MDIVERLRDGVNRHYGKDPAGLLHEAADEIERLREALKEAQCNCESTCLHGRYCSSWIAKNALKGDGRNV